MKLIFKIYKKVRELKTEEREVKKNIERYKLDSNKYLKEEEIRLRRSINTLKEELNKGWIDYCSLQRSGYVEQVREEYKDKAKHLEEREDALNIRKQELNEREEEINEMQRKLNDQILKLGIVNGVNN